MRIGVFTNVLVYRPSGIGWHVINLLENLALIDHENEYFLFYRVAPGKKQEPRFKPAAPNFHNVPVVAPALFYSRFFRVFDHYLLPRAIAARKIDIFHGPNHYLPPRARTRIPQVVTYHDLAEAKFTLGTPAQQEEKKQAIRHCLAQADHVIAISTCTKTDVTEYAYPPEKISVIYQGGNFDGPQTVEPNVVTAAKRAFGVTRPYVLFVGSLVKRKNLGFLLRAFARLKGALPDPPQLVLAGADDTPEAHELKQLAKSLAITDDLVLTGYLNNNQVRGLYGGARVFVLPSLYEGFGMVALEAMAYRVPVIAANAGSLPEVVDNAGILVNLADEAALADSIKRLLTDDRLHADLVAKGLKRVEDFKWSQTAKQTLDVYRALRPGNP